MQRENSQTAVLFVSSCFYISGGAPILVANGEAVASDLLR